MAISAADVPDGVEKYWKGADDAAWRGAAFWDELEQLGLTSDTSAISTHGDLERHLFSSVSSSVTANGYMEPQEVLLVASWKTDRSLRCVAMNERALRGALVTKTKEAFRPGLSTGERMAILCSLHGVGVGVASALLTVFGPERFSVADWRALQTLRRQGESAGTVPFASHQDNGWWYSHYGLYVDGCRAIAEREGVSLRNLDRYLWRWSRDHGKEKSGIG